MFGICAWRFVPALPSGRFHTLLNVPPTPPGAKGVTTRLSGLLSLSGVPKKPHTTEAFEPGGAGAWMWAATRLSNVSGVCAPVTSMLKIVAVNVMVSAVVSRVKVAVPNESGLGAPVLVVGGVVPAGGGS